MDALFILASQCPFFTDTHHPAFFNVLTGYFIAYTFIIRERDIVVFRKYILDICYIYGLLRDKILYCVYCIQYNKIQQKL